MKYLRTFALKTQFAIIVAFLIVFAIGAGLSNWLWSKSQLKIVMNMHDMGMQDFHGKIEALGRASQNGFLIILCCGLLTSWVLAYVLSRYIIEPIHLLDEYTKAWRPGQIWSCQVPVVSPEINSLFQHMQDLMESLNEELRKEKDIGRLKSQLVSMVSHELNNSLSVIHAASSTLEETDPGTGDKKRERMYRILKAQVLTFSRIIGNLLNMGRLESGKLSLDRKEMDISATLKSSIDLMEILYQNKNLRVSIETLKSPILVYADPEALTLVITNLLSNAIKYTPEGGSIVVGCEQEKNHPEFIQVYVKDTGIGISLEDRGRIFSGHYRSEQGKRMGNGFGIGLSLAKNIIEAHGGRIDIESQLGLGSKFFFLLPIWIPNLNTKKDGNDVSQS